ncbi:hypothetical protein [Galbibacter pacificus]|uniref:Uncharacterized protein n=1 Tax=Galbibacter pacificus TaxID=2996052 RepID=A0ABT6FMH5_9FLAO|nr:hypothetical protein [Galbibacter pacificus]MDG3580980.1 hypothetical protein [Galbibacter pacificus]MDG3584458.1 hypothetical protein [Galbibacter pacificus]
MKPFNFKEKDILVPELYPETDASIANAVENPGLAAYKLPKNRGSVIFTKEDSIILSEKELSNQFIVFQLSDKADGAAIFESSEVTPSIEGNTETPDVLMNLDMQSFHIGDDVKIDKNTRATMRINIGQDESTVNSNFDIVFWSIAAGLDLYNNEKKEPATPKDLKADFKQAFGNRPIEIPGGLAKMTFEVVKHEEPKWWQRIFNFFQSKTGRVFTSTIGFPAITHSAINLIDELLNKLDKSSPEVLFKSRPLRLALSQKAKNNYTGGNERIKIGALSPGFCVLARGKDFMQFINADAFYYPTYGKLVPASVSNADLVSGNYEDPFKNVTYAIFRVGMQAAKLDPTFSFGSE